MPKYLVIREPLTPASLAIRLVVDAEYTFGYRPISTVLAKVNKTELRAMIKHSSKINASAEALFLLTQDYSRRLEWDSFLKEARVIAPDILPGVGVKTFCRAWNGIGIETKYVTFEAPRVAAVKMTQGPYLFSEFAATWKFDQQEDGTFVTFIYHFKTRPAFLSSIVRIFLNLEIRRRLRDLKAFVEGDH